MEKRRFILHAMAVTTAGLLAIVGAAYHFSLEMAVANTVENELPLTGDTVYSEIQKDLIRPVYVSSEMANDAFLREWVLSGEKDEAKIVKYLSEVRQKHGLVSCFFVSAITRRYYYPEGILKQVSPNTLEDAWFFRVSGMAAEFETNVDPDAANGDELTVFVNYRVFDFNGRFIGAAGLGLPLSRVLGSVEQYGSQFKRRILLVDKSGAIIAQSEKAPVTNDNIFLRPGLSDLAERIVKSRNTSPQSLQYRNPENGHVTRVNARYISELDWSLIVEKDDESQGVLQILTVSIPIALITLGILVAMHTAASRAHARRILHKTEMLAVTSHDLRHFVHTLYILLASMTHSCAQRKNHWACMEMEKIVTGLDELITRFLAYYRLDAGADRPRLSAVRLDEQIRQLASETRPQLDTQHRGLTLGTIPDCWLSTDPVLLKVILRNFFSNAIKYVDKGDVTVEATLNHQHKTARIEISDAGSKLTRKQLQGIFAKFERGAQPDTKDGIGLGLHLVTYYAKKLGCRVGAHASGKDRGTSFWITVPLADEDMIARTYNKERDTHALITHIEFPLRNKRVAVIAPDQTLSDLIEKWGASVAHHPSIDALLESISTSEKIDCVVIDTHFNRQPDSDAESKIRSGTSPLTELHHIIGDKIPIIIFDAPSVPSSGNAAKNPSPQNLRHIRKPIKPAKLKLILVRTIAGNQNDN